MALRNPRDVTMVDFFKKFKIPLKAQVKAAARIKAAEEDNGVSILYKVGGKTYISKDFEDVALQACLGDKPQELEQIASASTSQGSPLEKQAGNTGVAAPSINTAAQALQEPAQAETVDGYTDFIPLWKDIFVLFLGGDEKRAEQYRGPVWNLYGKYKGQEGIQVRYAATPLVLLHMLRNYGDFGIEPSRAEELKEWVYKTFNPKTEADGAEEQGEAGPQGEQITSPGEDEQKAIPEVTEQRTATGFSFAAPRQETASYNSMTNREYDALIYARLQEKGLRPEESMAFFFFKTIAHMFSQGRMYNEDNSVNRATAEASLGKFSNDFWEYCRVRHSSLLKPSESASSTYIMRLNDAMIEFADLVDRYLKSQRR